jgi:hypothetical protein
MIRRMSRPLARLLLHTVRVVWRNPVVRATTTVVGVVLTLLPLLPIPLAA